MSLLESAEKLERKGNYFGSLELVLKVLESEPDNLKALELKASLCEITGRNHEAIRAYKKLLRFYGNNDKVWSQLYALKSISSSYWYLKNFEKTISYCEKSIELCERFSKIDGPQKADFIEELIGILWLLGGYQCESKKHSRAIDTYKKLLRLQSRFGCLKTIAEALQELASTYYELNRSTEALSKYSEVLKIYEVLEESLGTLYDRSRVHYYLGCIRFAARDFKKALFHLEKCVLVIEEILRKFKGECDEKDFVYKRAKRLLNSLRENKLLWKK